MKLNLVNFLLHENKIMYEKIEKEFDQVLRTEYPANYIDIKVIKHNATLKVAKKTKRLRQTRII